MEKGLISGLQRIAGLKRIGVFGGTFDPVHLGHLVCAEEVREAIGLDTVVFIPCAIPPHKPDYVPADPSHRLTMLELALEGHPEFTYSDLEIERGGVSYTIDTIAELRKRLGNEPEFWLILGLDAYLEINTWKQPERITSECFLAVARRPGYAASITAVQDFQGRARFVDITEIGISSTEIRRRIAQGQSIRFLVPKAVEDYIYGNRLYKSGG